VIELDTASSGEAMAPQPLAPTDIYRIDVADRSVVVLRRPRTNRPHRAAVAPASAMRAAG